MPDSMDEILHRPDPSDPAFPNAPRAWSPDAARQTAGLEGIELSADHWEVIRALHEYVTRLGDRSFNVRQCTDALDEKFHAHGGLRYLYQLFPGGPIAQGCRLAGLEPPAGVRRQPAFSSNRTSARWRLMPSLSVRVRR